MLARAIAAIIAAIVALVVMIIGGWDPHSGGERVGGAPPSRRAFDEYCFPKKYAVQKHQLAMGRYMAPGHAPREILIFHKIGSGKTCLSIQIGEKWVAAGHRPLYVMPASLIPGFRAELRGGCSGGKYALSGADPHKDPIDKVYQVFSYNKFANEAAHIRAPIIIVDEVQNVLHKGGAFNSAILDWIRRNPRSSVVIMSATPIFDSPEELRSIAALLRADIPREEPLTPDVVRQHFAGRVSYFAGAPEFTFPQVEVKTHRCPMSRHQAQWYRAQVETEMKASGALATHKISNDFYIKSRQRSNIAFPNGLTGTAALDALTPNMIRNSLDTYSAKFAKLIGNMRKAPGALAFIYTNFTGPAGIAAIAKCLEVALGMSGFEAEGPGPRRYAVWSGDQNGAQKDAIRAAFNAPANDSGKQIQVVIGSPSIKEGVSLLRVRHVHVIETYWNHSRLEQIFGRAVRYCSHKSVPPADRRVEIHMYAAVDKSVRLTSPVRPEYSIDLYMLHIADEKQRENEPLLEALIESSIEHGK